MKALLTYSLITLGSINILEIIIAAQLSFILFAFTMALAVARLKLAYSREPHNLF
jgi:hypothetical protein